MAAQGQIEFIVADLSRFSEREIVALALDIDSNLRAAPPEGTPIDTGWASANWVPSVGSPSALADNRDPTPADISARRAAGRQGLNAVLSWKLEDGPIFVSNGVVYIARLNDGHSKQSQPGFVQRALEQAVVDRTKVAARNREGGEL